MTPEERQLDADFDVIRHAQQRLEINEAVYLRAIEAWFRRTDAALNEVHDALKAQPVKG